MNNYTIFINKVLEGEKYLQIYDKSDVVVAGGGPAGIIAAIAAARLGVKVTLIENNSFLGGVATGAMMSALAYSKYATGIVLEFLNNLVSKGGAPKLDFYSRRDDQTIPFDVEVFKHVALEMVINTGVNLMLYTRICEPIIINGEIKGVVTESKSGRFAVIGQIVVDCTGDADLAYNAGAPFEVGRKSDNKMRPFALLFRLGGLNIEKIVQYVKENPDELQPQYTKGTHLMIGNEQVIARISGFYKLVEKAKKNGDLFPECHYFRLETLWNDRGIALCNTTRIYNVDGTKVQDLTKGEIEGRKQIYKLVYFVIHYIPGGENAFLLDVGSNIGVRETRRIIGEYYLSDDDAYTDSKFDDAIITFLEKPLVKRPIPTNLDVHMADPLEGSPADLFERYPERIPFEKHSFQIPYRVLLPKSIDNLLVAGRSISVSHMIDSFTRNMIICMQMGQVAGVSAALALKKHLSPKKLNFEDIKIKLVK